jgi:polyisoprenoid-binding protein YceI
MKRRVRPANGAETMTRKTLFATALMTAAIGGAAIAQDPLRLTIRPNSKLTIDGSSNVHDWSCNSSEFAATVEVNPDFPSAPLTDVVKPITSVTVVVPVKSLKCGHNKMDANMYKALKADEFGEIRYTLTSHEVDRTTATADSFTALTKGQLTVSGKQIAVEIPVKTVRQLSGAAIGEGSVTLKMTDFGITPPVALLGALRTRNEIEIAFRVLLDKQLVVALWQP